MSGIFYKVDGMVGEEGVGENGSVESLATSCCLVSASLTHLYRPGKELSRR